MCVISETDVEPQDIVVTCEVRCRGEPRYRLWVSDELFTERRWRWGTEYYLEEVIAVRARPGKYTIRYELVPGDRGEIAINNYRIEQGSAIIDQNGSLEINHENT